MKTYLGGHVVDCSAGEDYECTNTANDFSFGVSALLALDTLQHVTNARKNSKHIVPEERSKVGGRQ